MKKNLTVAVIILLVVLLTSISFIGIYRTVDGSMQNVIPGLNFGLELEGARNFKFVLSTEEEEKEVYVDEQGNTHGYVESDTSLDLENAEEFDTAEDAIESNEENKTELPYNTEKRIVKDNPDEVLNIESYEKSKAIIIERLKTEGAVEYNIRLNQDDGSIIVELPNSDESEYLYSVINSKGEFILKDSQNGERLINNSHIDSAQVVGGASSTGTGTDIYLQITLNKEGTKKLEEISQKYVAVPSEVEGEDDTITYVTAEMDGSALVQTYFGEKIATGVLNIPVARSITDEESYNSYLKSAYSMANIINSGLMPNQYTLESDNYIISNITKSDFRNLMIVAACLLLGVSAILVVKYKLNGFMAAVTSVGYIACLNLMLRLTGVIITISGLVAFVAGIVINYYFIIKLLERLKKAKNVAEEYKNTLKETIFILIPVIIAVVVYTLENLNVITSIGQVLFWSIVLIPIYNYIFTRNVLSAKSKK